MSNTLHAPAKPVVANEPPVDEYAAPPGAAEFSLWIAVVLIGVMFAAGCIGYAAVRQHNAISVSVPLVFWASTAVLNVSSAVLYYAMLSDGAGHRVATRRAMEITTLLALAFLVLQGPGLMKILAAHQEAIGAGHGVYAAMLVLVSLHAAHVIVGLFALLTVTRRVLLYPAASHRVSIGRVSIYWHGLTVIWLVLFSLLVWMR